MTDAFDVRFSEGDTHIRLSFDPFGSGHILTVYEWGDGWHIADKHVVEDVAVETHDGVLLGA